MLGLLISGLRVRVLAACLAVLALAGAAQATVIDEFSGRVAADWPLVLTQQGTNVATPTETTLAGVLGGMRQSALTAQAMDVNGLDEVALTVFTGPPSVLDYSSSSGGTGSVYVKYGTAISGGPLLGLNPVALPLVQINFLRYDFPSGQPLTLTLTPYQGTTAGTPLIAQTVGAGAQTVTFNLAGSGLTSLDGLQLGIDAPQAADFRIESITDVPEPVTLALLAAGAGLLALRRRRQR